MGSADCHVSGAHEVLATNDEWGMAVALHPIPERESKGGTVFRKNVIAAAALVACSGLVGVAQSPSPTTQQPAPSQQTPPQAAAAPASITLTGCVYSEKDVPGRAPNVAERAGVLEDYILADAKPASASGAVGTSGSAGSAHGMYKLELIADEKLKAVVGKRVEVTGRIDAEAGDSKSQPAAPPAASPTDQAIGRDKVDLPEFEVTSIKEVAGSCPAAPAGK